MTIPAGTRTPRPGEVITIPLDRRKLLLLLAGAAAFVAIGVWMFRLDPAWIRAQRRFNDPFLMHALGLAAILFFGLAGGIGAFKLFDRRPGLTLSEAGLDDHSSAAAAGLVPWGRIRGVDTMQVQRQKLLLVELADPEQQIAAGPALTRALRRMTFRMYGTPIAISASALQIPFEELEELCRAYHRRYGSPVGGGG